MKNILVMDNFLWIILVLNMFAHASTLWAYNHVDSFRELNTLVIGTLNNIYVFLLVTGLTWVSIVVIYNVFKNSNRQNYYHLLRLTLAIVMIMDFFIDLLSIIGAIR